MVLWLLTLFFSLSVFRFCFVFEVFDLEWCCCRDRFLASGFGAAGDCELKARRGGEWLDLPARCSTDRTVSRPSWCQLVIFNFRLRCGDLQIRIEIELIEVRGAVEEIRSEVVRIIELLEIVRV